MTELSAADELHVLSAIKDGTYFIEERMLLDVSVIDADGAQTVSETLLNDVVVTKGAISRIVDISVYVDGQTTMSFRGDGIIVSTPTGSTGYSLSAGGPIIEPKAKCIAVTPICPHALSIKSFVLDSGREIVIETGEKSESGYISIDGNDHIELAKGGKVVIKKSEKTLAMIRITKQGFYDRINGKLVNFPFIFYCIMVFHSLNDENIVLIIFSLKCSAATSDDLHLRKILLHQRILLLFRWNLNLN